MTDYTMEVIFINRTGCFDTCTGNFHFDRLCEVVDATSMFAGDSDVICIRIYKTKDENEVKK